MIEQVREWLFNLMYYVPEGVELAQPRLENWIYLGLVLFFALCISLAYNDPNMDATVVITSSLFISFLITLALMLFLFLVLYIPALMSAMIVCVAMAWVVIKITRVFRKF